MPTGYQITNQGAVYFITLQVVYWIDLFTRQCHRDVILESLRYCQKNKGLEIYAWVIMSNHVHLVVRSANEDLSGTLRDFKKFTSKNLVENVKIDAESRRSWILKLFEHAAKRSNKKGRYQVWTHSNHAIELISHKFIDQKINYIHMNPVKAGIVVSPELYLYSSAPCYNDEKGLLDVIVVT